MIRGLKEGMMENGKDLRSGDLRSISIYLCYRKCSALPFSNYTWPRMRLVTELFSTPIFFPCTSFNNLVTFLMPQYTRNYLLYRAGS